MTVPKILPSGVNDLEIGKEFYDSQENGLGIYFLEAIFTEIESLRIYSGIHSKKYNHHRLLVEKFPYAIYYKVEANVAVIHRILDCRQNPDDHKKALR